MSQAVLRRIDLLILRSKSSTDNTQVVVPGARVDFYRQGATAAADATAAGSGGVVSVFDLGQIVVNDTVMAGIGGPLLTVTAVNVAARAITVSNPDPTAVQIPAQTRLIPTGNRPSVYDDLVGTGSGADFAVADASGRVRKYINQRRFDYVVSEAGIAVTVNASAFNYGAGDFWSLSWSHNPTGVDRLLLVGVSWQETTGTEVITSVVYGTQQMTRLGASNYTALYYLVNPDLGPKTIVVNWSGDNPKAAIVGSVSFAGVEQSGPVGVAIGRSGNGPSSANVMVPRIDGRSRVFGVFAVSVVQEDATVSPSGLWNAGAGTEEDFTATVGCGQTSNTGTIAWSWEEGNQPFGIVATEVRAAGTRLVIDAEGSGIARARSKFDINVLDYKTVQDAVNDAPAGAVVYFPAGAYNSATLPQYLPPLVLPDRPIHLLGEGAGPGALLQANTSTPGDRMLWITSDDQIVEGLGFGAFPPVTSSTMSGIVIGRSSNPERPLIRPSVRRCNFIKVPAVCILLDDTDGRACMNGIFEDLNCDSQSISGSGGIQVGRNSTANVFERVRVRGFAGFGVRLVGCRAVSLRDCTIEESFAPLSQPYVLIDSADGIVVDHCYFETSGGDFIQSVGCCRGLRVDSCRFHRDDSTGARAIRLDGTVLQGVIVNPWCSSTASNPTVGDIIISSSDSEVVIIGGTLVSANRALVVVDSSLKTLYLGTRARVRLPRLTEAERGSSGNVGEMIYNLTTNKVQAYLSPGVWSDL